MVEIFSSLSSIAAFNVIASEAIIKLFKIDKSVWKQVISWTISVLISVLGFVFGIGMFSEFGTITSVTGWIYTVISGVLSGLVSNGIYDISYVKNIFDYIKNLNFKINK